MTRVALLLATVLLALPAGAASLDVRHDPDVDFSAYETFAIVESDAAQIPEIRQHLVRRIAEQLTDAGLRRVDDGADLNVEIHVTTQYGGGVQGLYLASVNWDFAVLSVSTRTFADGTLIVAIVDAAEERGVWQAVASKTFQGSDYDAYRKTIDRVTRKMFKKFPPRP